MSAITQSYKIDMTSGAVPLRIKVSQYDAGIRTLTFWLYNLGTKLTSSQLSSLTAYVQGTKEDQKGFEYECTAGFSSEGCYVDVEITEQMTACAGDVICELVLTAEDVRIGSTNFVLEVEKAALGADTDISETELPDIIDAGRRYAEQAEDAAERAEEAAAGVDNYALAGAGKMTGYSDGVINTNVYLHREPKVGDRLLIRMTQTFTDSTPIKIYKESGGTAYTLSFDMWSDQYKLEGLCLVEIVEFLQNLALRFLYSFNGASLSAGQYIGITGGGYINNTAPQLGDNSDYIEITNADDGDLGAWNYYARYALVNFKVNATPYSTTGEYVIKLARGSVLEDASLVDRDGNDYTKPIKAGTVLLCVINAGTDTVTVVNDDIIANSRVLDGNGNDLASVAALEQSASGNPIIVNAQGIDAKELSVELEPIQDLHGLPFPYVGGAYKNKLLLTVDSIKTASGVTWSNNSYTVGGITFTILTDDANNVIGIKMNGKSTAIFALSIFDQNEDATAYNGMILNGVANGSASTYGMRISDTAVQSLYNYTGGTSINGLTNTGRTQVVIRFMATDVEVNNVIIYPMISTEGGTFAPYSNICPISGRTEARVDDVGKNLIAGWRKNTAIDNNGEPYTSVGSVTTSNKIHAEVGDSFIYSSEIIAGAAYYIQSYDAYDNYIGYKQITFGTAFIPTNFDSRIRSFYIQINGSNIGNTPPETAQLERGSTATPYEPYAHSSATIQLGTTVYGGTLNVTTGVLTIIYAFIIYDGSSDEEWSASIAGSGAGYRCRIDTPTGAKIPSNNGETANIICNQFKAKTANQTYLGNEGVSIQNGGGNPLDVYSVSFNTSDISLWKTFLSNNPLQICYELATPITIQLTPTQLEMLKGYNYITADGEMQLVYVPESVLDEAQANAKAYTDNKVPDAPTTDGTYRLTCTVTDGVPTFSWESVT